MTGPRGRYCLIGEVPFDRGNRFIEGDPFSCYLNDGQALIWGWRECGTLREDEKSIQAIISRIDPLDVYFLLTTATGDGFVVRLLSLRSRI